MKKLTVLFSLLLFTSCSSNSTNDDNGYEYEYSDSKTEWPCGTHNGKTLYIGPQGGCYYYNSNGNKTYVDRSECNC